MIQLSRRMGGVAGHAGLFSTAGDVPSTTEPARPARRQAQPIPPAALILEKMTTPGQPATGTALRGLGWDIESPFSSNRGELFPVGSFGHTGFTGTSLWMDPSSDTYVVFMSNAVYPNGPTGINAIRGAVATAIARWVKRQPDGGALAATLTGYNESISGERRWQDRNGKVITGIDGLEDDHFAELAALAANHGERCVWGCSPTRPDSMRMAAEPSTSWSTTQKRLSPASSSSSSSVRNTGSMARSIRKVFRTRKTPPPVCPWSAFMAPHPIVVPHSKLYDPSTPFSSICRMRAFASIPTRRWFGTFSEPAGHTGQTLWCWTVPTH